MPNGPENFHSIFSVETNSNLPWHKQLASCALVFFSSADNNFLSDPGVPGVRSMGPDVSPSVTERLCSDLTDVTLADEDSNSTPSDDVNRAILGNVAMQVAPPGGQN